MKKVLRNEEGFTLIEVIAVLVILGVLAAVAVPNYLDLMEKSKEKAAEGAVAAGFSNVAMQYGKFLLSTESEAPALSYAVSECQAKLSIVGDYNASYGNTGNAVSVSVEKDGYSGLGSFSAY